MSIAMIGDLKQKLGQASARVGLTPDQAKPASAPTAVVNSGKGPDGGDVAGTAVKIPRYVWIILGIGAAYAGYKFFKK